MDIQADNLSNRSRSSGGSSNGNTPGRRSSGSTRNANADNIQRAHEHGGRSPISNGNGSDKNTTNSPRRAPDGKRKCSTISPIANEPAAKITDQNGNDSSSLAVELAPRQRHVVKKQMRQVVGDLETVIGELRTVMGDLKTLVNQIDVVTERLDRQYPEEGDIKRRLSASVVESPRHKTTTPMRHSMSHSHDIQRMSAPPLFSNHYLQPAALKDGKAAASRNGLVSHVMNGPSPSRVKPRVSPETNKRDSNREIQGSVKTVSNPPSSKTSSSSEKQRGKKSSGSGSKASKSSNGSSDTKSNRHSVPSTTKDYDYMYKETSCPLRIVEELASPLDAKTILDNLPRREVLIPPCFFTAIENNISTRVVKNKSRSSTQLKCHKKTKSDTTRIKPDCHMIWSDTFSDSWFDTADRSSVRSRCSSGHTQTRCSPHSDSPEVEYCGVYERELDEKLELEFDDHLDVFDTFDKDFDKPYQSKYDKNINTWKRYTMDYSSRDTSLDFSDDRLSDSVTETSSDILNDNFLPRTVNPTIVNYSWRTVIEPWIVDYI